jgi:sugar O-acyltransferase (sialic acid O-acetyltransferase NeuD family)
VADLVVLGTGTLGRMARAYFESDTSYRAVAFAVHERYLGEEHSCDGLPVLPFEQLAATHPPGSADVFVAAGYTRVNRNRSALFDEVRAAGYRPATYVSSRSLIWPGTPIGEGSFLFEGVIVQPGVRIGQGVIVWSGSAVNHDSAIDDFCFLASNVVVSGHVHLGHHTFAGANVTFRDNVATGPYSVIGAGAVIARDTAPRSVHAVRGTPARGDDSFDLERL